MPGCGAQTYITVGGGSDSMMDNLDTADLCVTEITIIPVTEYQNIESLSLEIVQVIDSEITIRGKACNT